MANISYLKISGHVFIARKWEIPPYLMLLFDLDDKQYQKSGKSVAQHEVSFITNVRKVKAKLDNFGLDLDSLQNEMKKLPLVAEEVIDTIFPHFLQNDENIQALLHWWEGGPQTLPSPLDFLLEELDTNFRFSPIGHLYLIRLLCDYLDDEAEIVLDPNEILAMWSNYDPIKTDIHQILLSEFADELEASSLFSRLLVFSIDDRELCNILHMLDENELTNYVIIPLLDKMGFESVTPTKFHGPGELGKDILPFSKKNEFGFREYYSAQVKARKIHAGAGKKGNVNEIIDQAKTALMTAFFDPVDNSRKRIDHLFIITLTILLETRVFKLRARSVKF